VRLTAQSAHQPEPAVRDPKEKAPVCGAFFCIERAGIERMTSGLQRPGRRIAR